MSIRLSGQEMKRLQTLADEEDKEKSSVARELLMDSLKYKMLLGYKEGGVSLAKLSPFSPLGHRGEALAASFDQGHKQGD